MNEERDDGNIDKILRDLEHKVDEQVSTISNSERDKKAGIFIGTIVGVVIAVILICFLFSYGKPKEEEKNIPTIQASDTDVKIKPKEEGGMQIPDLDKKIYNKIGTEPPIENFEKLLPSEETPKAPEVAIPPASKGIEEVEKEISAPQVSSIPTDAEKPAIKEEIEKTAISDSALTTEGTVLPIKEAESLSIPIVSKQENIESTTPASTPSVAINKDVNVKKEWEIQLLSLSSKQDAEKALNNIKTKYASTVNSGELYIEPTDLGAKGFYYRLKLGIYTEEQARKICEELKQKGQTCLVVKKK